MRILGQVCVRNEADRYLDCCLAWQVGNLDAVHVFDDRSTDDTVKVATGRGATVTTRSEAVPSFLRHEGRFREAGWHAFEAAMKPEPGDWVFAFDADEFLVAQNDEYESLHEAVGLAQRDDAVGVIIPIPEVFATEETDGLLVSPSVRVDGFWGRIAGFRFFRYQPGGTFTDKAMGCGSEPTYVANGPKVQAPNGLNILHYGYATPEDQKAKYARYSSLADNGHASAHVESILVNPELQPWNGPSISVWRGLPRRTLWDPTALGASAPELSVRAITNTPHGDSVVDMVTVAHNSRFQDMAVVLRAQLDARHPGDDQWNLRVVDNSIDNRGFGKACNIGAAESDAGIIGFLNPDVHVTGEFLTAVRETLAIPGVVVTGSSFGKDPGEYRMWGCRDWVCGAAFFVRRDWWDLLGGFDESYVWGWEETDFIRRTQMHGGAVRAIDLALTHESPSGDTAKDRAYKARHFQAGAFLFQQRWPQ